MTRTFSRTSIGIHLAAAALVVAAAMPLAASAAGNAQFMLDTAVLGVLMPKAPIRFDGRVTVQTEPTIDSATGAISGSGSFFQQAYPNGKAIDTDNSFTLEAYSQSKGQPTFAAPFSIDWRTRAGTTYFSFSHLGDTPGAILDDSGFDHMSILGKWVSSKDSVELQLASGEFAPIVPKILDDVSKASAVARTIPWKSTHLLLVTRNDGSQTQADGTKAWRLEMRINPAALTIIEKADRAAVPKSDPDRTMILAAIGQRYSRLKKASAAVNIIVDLDPSSGTLKRIMIAGTINKPCETCATPEDPYAVCISRNVKTMHFTVDATVSGATGGPGQVDGAETFSDFLNGFIKRLVK